MKYKFRLVFFNHMPGFFHIDEKSIIFAISDELKIEVFPRDSDALISASKYHIDCGGFESKQKAKEAGEKLRHHLRLLNCVLNLGLSIPVADGNSGYVSDGIKEKVRADGAKLLDTIIGLYIYPDDQAQFEHVSYGKLNVYPSDPYYVLRAVKETWPNSFDFDENALEVLEILNISVRESSPKIKFLTSYLAMEQVIKREMRSDSACKLIDEFIKTTNESNIACPEKKSLIGSLGHLKEQSFSSAFQLFASRVRSPEKIKGISIKKFVSQCIGLRNKIAHNAAINMAENLEEYAKYLREMALGIIWTENDFPSVSVYRPADMVSMDKMEIRMM